MNKRKIREANRIKKRIKAEHARQKARNESDWERVAIEYASFVAAKRQIETPETKWGCKPRAIWSGVYRRSRTERMFFEKRIQAVEWGTWEEIYNTRKDGRRGAFARKEWTAQLSIELPYWDWIPETEDLSLAA